VPLDSRWLSTVISRISLNPVSRIDRDQIEFIERAPERLVVFAPPPNPSETCRKVICGCREQIEMIGQTARHRRAMRFGEHLADFRFQAGDFRPSIAIKMTEAIEQTVITLNAT
jgi:hypothetical protein